MISRRFKKKKLPNKYLKNKPVSRNDTDSYSCWTDRSVPTPAQDSDPRMAEDALDPEKPRGAWTNATNQ